ncbi:MAG: hypothetical protein FJ291_32920 [Planctomycetes bacterium]|nr:hypothetical protein [Planctomycetota bacterium]
MRKSIASAIASVEIPEEESFVPRRGGPPESWISYTPITLRDEVKDIAWSQAPMGFWPEILFASALALVHGKTALEQVLRWLAMARERYGYAWRVLVDWRHLASVKDHPLFVEFMRQEDELVDEIEGAIDRGEYTL